MYVTAVIKSGFFFKNFHAQSKTKNSHTKSAKYKIILCLYVSSKNDKTNNAKNTIVPRPDVTKRTPLFFSSRCGLIESYSSGVIPA